MVKNYETRHVFLGLAMSIAILSLLLLIFIPQTIADIAHYSPDMWHVFVPKENRIMYAIGFLFLFLAAMIPFFMNVKKISILISVACILLSFIPFFIGSQSYIIFADDGISYSPLLSTKVTQYSWNEVSVITYFEAEEGERSEYEFLFHDNHTISLEENLYFISINTRLLNKLEEISLNIVKVKMNERMK